MISIIIPTLNEEKTLENTLLPLFEYKNNFPGQCEIIISDGKSKDRTIEIARKYADKVTIYQGEKRQTIAMGRNLGVREARGDILLFLDADIHIPHIDEFLKKALSNFQNDSDLVALTVCLNIFPDQATFADRFFSGAFNTMVAFYNNVLHYGASSGEFQMVRTEIFKQAGGFNESLVAGEDFEFFRRLSHIGRTQCDTSLHVFHSGRRVHKIGWPKLLWSWFKNWYYATFFKISKITQWEEVR